MRLRLDLSYDGANFKGWGVQPDLRTVQGTIETAIATILRLPKNPSLTCAGRTDAGVHARGQVAHVDLEKVDPATLERRLRRLLPHDISLKALTVAADGFDARYAALERRYIYRMCDSPAGPDPLERGTIVQWRRPLDVDAMNSAATLLLGHHDFASFCKRREGATTVRTLRELHTVRNGSMLEATVRADAFCHSMVRSLMGVIVAVGEGRFEPSWAGEVLAHVERNARATVLPPHGLVLEEVIYPDAVGLAVRAEEARRRMDK